MLVRPLPGVNRDNLQRTLLDVATRASDVRGAGGTVIERRTAYIRWANDAVRVLWRQVSATDLDHLVRTRAYWTLQTMDAGHALAGLLDVEIEERVAVLDEAHKAVKRQIEQWSRPGYFVVADTSVYIEHPNKINDLDLAPLIGAREEPIHLLVPIIVIDELDGLKKASNQTVRRRSRHTLQALDQAFANTTGPVRLQPADFAARDDSTGRGEVSIEIVFDPPGHIRLPINDDEIIDRTVAIEVLAGRHITLLTYDTGQSTRGRAAGLQVKKLLQPPEEGAKPRPTRSGDWP